MHLNIKRGHIKFVQLVSTKNEETNKSVSNSQESR